ncbi:hypothetical protein BaRGS_00005276 [Batillaria attramentaria]|uniref:Uncharacterized protein n=1 Tax=Batillaria attramentaria TaxID=370345 RepID=A0ABD0LW30_9CAEN
MTEQRPQSRTGLLNTVFLALSYVPFRETKGQFSANSSDLREERNRVGASDNLPLGHDFAKPQSSQINRHKNMYRRSPREKECPERWQKYGCPRLTSVCVRCCRAGYSAETKG